MKCIKCKKEMITISGNESFDLYEFKQCEIFCKQYLGPDCTPEFSKRDKKSENIVLLN